MNKVKYSASRSLYDDNYLENKVYGWFASNKEPFHEILVFEMYEGEFYFTLKDSKEYEFSLRKGNVSRLNEKEAKKLMDNLKSGGEYTTIVSFLDDVYNPTPLEVGLKEEDLYDLALSFTFRLGGKTDVRIISGEDLPKRKISEEKLVEDLTLQIHLNEVLPKEDEVIGLSEEEILKVFDIVDSYDLKYKLNEKGKIEMSPFALTFHAYRALFKESIRSQYKKSFDYLFNKFTLLSLEPTQDYLPVFAALDAEAAGESYYIEKLYQAMEEEGYLLSNSDVNSLLRPHIPKKFQEYPNSKFTDRMLKRDFPEVFKKPEIELSKAKMELKSKLENLLGDDIS